MVISTNSNPSKEEFEKLLDDTICQLSKESKKQTNDYLKLLRDKLEVKVEEVMKANAEGTPFEDTIKLISGQKFPDIIAKKYFGVEVKTTKQNHWTTTGNSVLETTRVDDVENIYLLFGKMKEPIEFKYRAYEECLSEVVVTHSPRYLIDMDLEKGKTIFDKINIPYNTLRNKENPIKPIIEYYKQQLDEGQEIWWIGEDKSKSLVVQFMNSIPKEKQDEYIAEGMVRFPEVFKGNYNQFTLWLYENESVICPNVRDYFSAGGQAQITWKNKKYTKIPKVIIKLNSLNDIISKILDESSKSELMTSWNKKDIKDIKASWIELVYNNLVQQTNFKDHSFRKKLKGFLKEKI